VQPSLRADAIRAQAAAAQAAANLQHELNLRQIDDQNSAAQNLAETSAQFLEIERLSHEQRLAEEERFQAEKKAIRERARLDALAADPSSPLSIFGASGQAAADQRAGLFGQLAASADEALSSVSDSLGNMQTIFEGAFSSIASGLGSMIESFILTGKVGPAAFKKLAAGVIAAVVAQAAVKAIFELAEGIAALARYDPVSASAHFAAAKTYGIVAGVAAAAGAAIAATGGGDKGKDEFAGGQPINKESRTIEQGGPLPQQQPQPIIIRPEITIQQPPISLQADLRNGVLEIFEDDYRANGRTRTTIREDVVL
jgi:hypothetical protein